MRHSAPRSRVRWPRLVIAGLSALTVGCSLLGATGAFTPAAPTDRAVVTDRPTARERTVAERSLDAEGLVQPKTSSSGARDRKRSTPATRTPAPQSADKPAPLTRATPPPDPKKQPVSFFDQPLPVPEGSGSGRRIVFSLSKQYVWLVTADGSIHRRYPVSGSRFDQVEPSHYDVIRKRRHTTSWHGTESMEYMVTFTFGENAAIGFHDIPRSLDTGKLIQTFDELGMALSDGCVRQRHADAAALWKFAPVDTPVVVVA